MKYTSTRDGSRLFTFEEALCSGYAPDGGLFVPQQLPTITPATLRAWQTLTYPILAYRVLRLFIDPAEVGDADLERLCVANYDGFVDPDQAVPLVPLGTAPLYIAELFHGPTFCFKDLGMRGVINLLSFFATQRERSIRLLVSTTGDTGPAAVQAVSDVANPRLNILVHYPEGQISDLQRKQLTTVASPYVRVATFQGGGDDMDKPIKNLLANQNRADTSQPLMTGVNSYNIGRPLFQMVHYIWVYLRVAEKMGDLPSSDDWGDWPLVDIVLPTGAMGNIAGGYMTKKMGLPLGKLNAAVNVNDITYRVVQTGEFHRSEAMHKTLSDAINIQVPYNFERLLFYLSDGQQSLVKEWYQTMEATTKLDLDAEWLTKLQANFAAARVTDDDMCAALKKFYEESQYLADPHTAVGLSGALQLGYVVDAEAAAEQQQRPTAVLATASPCKFQESVEAAVGSQVWQTYLDSPDFPPLAKEIMAKAEIAPVVYKALEGQSLEDSQVVWEATARSILDEFSNNSSN